MSSISKLLLSSSVAFKVVSLFLLYKTNFFAVSFNGKAREGFACEIKEAGRPVSTTSVRARLNSEPDETTCRVRTLFNEVPYICFVSSGLAFNEFEGSIVSYFLLKLIHVIQDFCLQVVIGGVEVA